MEGAGAGGLCLAQLVVVIVVGEHGRVVVQQLQVEVHVGLREGEPHRVRRPPSPPSAMRLPNTPLGTMPSFLSSHLFTVYTHVIRGELGSVMELDALAKLHGPDLRVGRHGVGFHQGRLHLACLPVDPEEPVVDEAREDGPRPVAEVAGSQPGGRDDDHPHRGVARGERHAPKAQEHQRKCQESLLHTAPPLETVFRSSRCPQGSTPPRRFTPFFLRKHSMPKSTGMTYSLPRSARCDRS